MQSAREFMEAYLHEQGAYIQWRHEYHRAFGEKYYSEECLKLPWIGYRSVAFAELLNNLEASGDTALAFTENARTREKWRRYHLRFRQGKWEIHNSDIHCGRCNGTGRYLEGMRLCDGKWVAHDQVESCENCGGSGWHNEWPFLKRA